MTLEQLLATLSYAAMALLVAGGVVSARLRPPVRWVAVLCYFAALAVAIGLSARWLLRS